MENLKEGNSVSRPLLLDGSNYAYWKVRMRALIKSIDEKAWKAVLVRWVPPTTENEDGEKIEKAETEWTLEEDRAANYNSKALNALFNGVDPQEFRCISTCISAHDAWTILETTHEGTDSVKQSKLQVLTTRFETLKTAEEETIVDFHNTPKNTKLMMK